MSEGIYRTSCHTAVICEHYKPKEREKSVMSCKGIFYLYLKCMYMITCAKASTYEEESNLHAALLTNYIRNVRPRSNRDESTDIELLMSLRSVTSLDELTGILVTVCIISVHWIDNNLIWEPEDHGNITDVILNKSLIWVPGLVVINPAAKVERLGVTTAQIHVTRYGRVTWEFGHVIHTTCDIDVTYFPFDTQECALELMPIGLRCEDMNLTSHDINTLLFSKNNAWVLKSTSVTMARLGSKTYAKYLLMLERRYTFYILNLFSPVLILAFLNAMVFMLPADSGERVGYAITCLLSLSVYMTFAEENLPNSSQPLPIITFILLAYIVISTLISVGTVIGLRLHLHDNTEPTPIVATIINLFCLGKGKCGEKPEDTETSESTGSKKSEDTGTEQNKSSKNGWIKPDVEVNDFQWKDVADRFDKLCFVSSNVCIFLFTVLYFVIVRAYT